MVRIKKKVRTKVQVKKKQSDKEITQVKCINKKDPHFKREAEKYAKPIPSREFIMAYLEQAGKPVSRSDLLIAFGLDSDEDKEALRRRLNAMLRDGQIIKNRRGSIALVRHMALTRGYVIGHKDGYGFLVPDDGDDDIYLGPRQMRLLFPGDQVLVSVVSENRAGKREGIIVEVLKRALDKVVGRYFEKEGVSLIIPINKAISQEIIISPGKQGAAKLGEIVVANIINYPSKFCNAIGEIVEVLGDQMAPGMEIEVAIRSYNLPNVWSDAALAEAGKLSKEQAIDANGRKNLKELAFVTIDGEDAKDFDDAVYCVKQPTGGWVLYVAIADVSHYVRFDSALDQEALARGNSVYFPGHVVPMLPEVLSNELCSLKPNVDRLVMVCEMQIDKAGDITAYDFYDAVICSHARLTYDQVYTALETNQISKPQLLPYLLELRNVYTVLMEQRRLRGALDFQSIETKIIFDEKGKIECIAPLQRNYAHSIIEECMLAANVCASKFLLQGKIPAIYRVHEGPDQEKLDNVRVFLTGLGLKLGGGQKPKPTDYADLLTKISGRPDANVIQTVLLRSLRKAVYTPKNVGHFGLAYEAYAHFTSPIRRYPDLLNHRAIRYLLHGRKVKDYAYNQDTIQKFSENCSMTEWRADDATRDAVSWLKCEFMQDKIGKVFAGRISGVTGFGIFVELKTIYVEGLVHVTCLPNDYYDFNPAKHCLIGKRSGMIYRLGDEVQVLVARVSIEERQIDFELA